MERRATMIGSAMRRIHMLDLVLMLVLCPDGYFVYAAVAWRMMCPTPQLL